MAGMATTHTHHQERQRAQAPRARGLDPEITAQPRLVRDDIGLVDEESAGSIDPDDLAVHFLSEAIQQGDFDARRETEREAELFEPMLDDDLDPEVTDATENTMWDYMFERSMNRANEPPRVESEEIDAEIRQVLVQLAESRARKAAKHEAAQAVSQPAAAPKRAKMSGAARNLLQVAARSLRRVADRMRR